MSAIGIVGLGYVGKAVNDFFKDSFNTLTYDLNGKGNCNDLNTMVLDSDIIFICVPTPMNEDGSCNVEIVENVIRDINNYILNIECLNKIIVIKSTIPPGNSRRLDLKYKNIDIVFNPEFLTESNYLDDFKNQNRIILGGSEDSTNTVQNIYIQVLPDVKIIKTSFENSEMVKYFINTFLSTKVAFANEMYKVCRKLDLDYSKILEYSLYDQRLGKTHFNVPGPDGEKGFGGSCFPKDITAMIYFIKSIGLNPEILNSVWESNIENRPGCEWKESVIKTPEIEDK